jgi:hypothetical protein
METNTGGEGEGKGDPDMVLEERGNDLVAPMAAWLFMLVPKTQAAHIHIHICKHVGTLCVWCGVVCGVCGRESAWGRVGSEWGSEWGSK